MDLEKLKVVLGTGFQDERFIVVDGDGNVVDNCMGYGFKFEASAKKAMWYKHKMFPEKFKGKDHVFPIKNKVEEAEGLREVFPAVTYAWECPYCKNRAEADVAWVIEHNPVTCSNCLRAFKVKVQ